MNLYEFRTTEHNGEQEYSHYHLVYADTIDDATRMVREFCSQWYEVEDPEGVVHKVNGKDEWWEFFGGEIVLELDNITETNANTFKEEAFLRGLTGGLPKRRINIRETFDCLEQAWIAATDHSILTFGQTQAIRASMEIINRIIEAGDTAVEFYENSEAI